MDIKKYEDIKKDILNRINTISTIEGSFADTVVSPTSLQLEKFYVELRHIYDKLYIENLHREELEAKIKERTNVLRKKGTIATGKVCIKALKGTIVQKDTLVSTISGLNFTTQEELKFNSDTTLEVNIIAKGVGSKYNVKANAINNLPVSINGVIFVNNTKEIKNGYDLESDKSLIDRYYKRIRTPATSGNKYHYLNWAKEVNGVEKAKVFPLWAGPGTVKVIIVNNNKKAPSKELINKVYNYIEEVRPIGANVTVTGAIEKAIDVTAKVVLANGFNIGQVQQEFIKLVDKYLKDVSFELSYASIARIGNILFNTPGVLDYSELNINNITSNIGLENEEIPVLGTVELEVI